MPENSADSVLEIEFKMKIYHGLNGFVFWFRESNRLPANRIVSAKKVYGAHVFCALFHWLSQMKSFSTNLR